MFHFLVPVRASLTCRDLLVTFAFLLLGLDFPYFVLRKRHVNQSDSGQVRACVSSSLRLMRQEASVAAPGRSERPEGAASPHEGRGWGEVGL